VTVARVDGECGQGLTVHLPGAALVMLYAGCAQACAHAGV